MPALVSSSSEENNSPVGDLPAQPGKSAHTSPLAERSPNAVKVVVAPSQPRPAVAPDAELTPPPFAELLNRGPAEPDFTAYDRGRMFRLDQFMTAAAGAATVRGSGDTVDSKWVKAEAKARRKDYERLTGKKIDGAVKSVEEAAYAERLHAWLACRRRYAGYAEQAHSNPSTLLVSPGGTFGLGSVVAPQVVVTTSAAFREQAAAQSAFRSALHTTSEDGKHPAIWVNCDKDGFLPQLMGSSPAVASDPKGREKGYVLAHCDHAVMVMPEVNPVRLTDSSELASADRFRSLHHQLQQTIRVCAATLSMQETQSPQSTVWFQGSEDAQNANFMAALFVLMQKLRADKSYNPSAQEMLVHFMQQSHYAGVSGGVRDLAVLLLGLEPNKQAVDEYLLKIQTEFSGKSKRKSLSLRRARSESSLSVVADQLVSLNAEMSNDLHQAEMPVVFVQGFAALKIMMLDEINKADVLMTTLADNHQLRAQAEQLALKAGKLQDSIAISGTYVKSLHAEAEKLRAELAAAEQKQNTLEKELVIAKSDRDMVRQLEKAKRDTAAAKQMLELIRQQLAATQEQLEQQETENDALHTEVTQLKADATVTKKQLVQEKARAGHAEERVAEKDKQLEQAARENKQLRQQLATMQKEKKALQTTVNEQGDTIEQQAASLVLVRGALKRLMSSRAGQIAATVISLVVFNVIAAVVGLIQLGVSRHKSQNNDWRFLFCMRQTKPALLEDNTPSNLAA